MPGEFGALGGHRSAGEVREPDQGAEVNQDGGRRLGGLMCLVRRDGPPVTALPAGRHDPLAFLWGEAGHQALVAQDAVPAPALEQLAHVGEESLELEDYALARELLLHHGSVKKALENY